MKYKKHLSYRWKILYLPILIVSVAIIVMVGFFSYFLFDRLHGTILNDGINYVQYLAGHFKTNEEAIEAINNQIEERIRTACNIVINNEDSLSDEYLIKLLSDLQVDEIYWFDKDGTVIYGTDPGYIGWKVYDEHPLSILFKGQKEIMEDIRKDVKFGRFVKYGAVRSEDGAFVQVGISADKVNEFMNKFSYQSVAEEIALRDNIAFASVLNADGIVVAGSDTDDIGHVKHIEEVKNVISYNNPFAWEHKDGSLNEIIYEVLYPLSLNGETRVLEIGYLTKDAHTNIAINIAIVLIITFLILIILIILLDKVSIGVLESIENIKHHLALMATGNFTTDIPEKLTNKTDEFGAIANSLKTTQGSIKEIIAKKEKAEKLLSKSEFTHRMLVEKMQLGFVFHEIITDDSGMAIDYKFLNVNKKYEELTGLKRKDILGKTVRDILPQVENYWIKTFGEVAINGETKEFESYSEPLDRWYQVVAYPMGNKQFAVITDEITNRKMMEELLYLEKEQFKTTLLSIGDGVISTDNKGRVTLMNEVAENMTGWTEKEAMGMNFMDVFPIVHEYTFEKCENIVECVIQTGNVKELANHTALIKRNGSLLPIEDSAAPIRNQEGEISGVVIVFRDFSEKREKLNQIEFLSYHDYLTGLHNRRYMEEAIRNVDKIENMPLAVMVLDINGLKLTNDAFGHEMGDKLLREVAAILRNNCRKQDVLARMGGDEFCILLPNSTEAYANSLKEKITQEISYIKLESVIASVAIGYQVKTHMGQDMDVVLKNADNHMYEEKTKQGKFMRNQVVESVVRSINIKYENEQIHTERVAEFCELIAKEMGFSEREIQSIKLAGTLHDIGKIMVPPELLNKVEKLTDEEFDIIKKHSETGYQILRNTYEYAGLAKIIRHHHERYDGKGYPDKLQGDSIPLESRIITVADAYEAMTAVRPYQKQKSKDEALEEIEKCSGTQFDPVIAQLFLKLMRS